ncbi:MAG TPA: HAMP domain-containing sensor histidine kinase [Polyangiaceae bacterium]|nr:HAMP domain-containing sensor histidine kinase [Polyangiaceae bacterium]
MLKPRRLLRDGLPLLPAAPLLVVIVGVAVAIAVTLVGVADLRRTSDEASSLRARVIASTLAARLRVTGSEDRMEVVQGAARGTYADILLIDHYGEVVADASLGPPPRPELVRCLLAGNGIVSSPLLGRTRFAVQPLGPPLEWLSVIAMVPAPLTPTEASSLVKAVAMLTGLLVGAAGMVAYVFANDVRNDVTYVRHRIAEMAAADNDPAGAPIPIRALDQVGVLTAAFNQLVGRFAAAERSYREDLTFALALDGERSAFLAALSHELRTPLNGILGFADVLLSEVEGTLDEATREELGVIRASASHLRSLIDDILELSALESGGLKLRREPVDVYAVAEEVVREQRPLAADKKLVLDLQGSRGAMALADPQRLRQILGNIVGNAVKFTNRGGVRVAVESENDEVVVHTIDTGPGIAPAERAAIFEEYAQAGDVAARRKGTGLGLAIARRLVAMHGGVIELESTLGQGSRFTFKLKPSPGEAP